MIMAIAVLLHSATYE